MPPFDTSLEPLALPGEAVRLQPDNEVYEVRSVEQMARVGPVDYGSASSNDNATESGSNTIDLVDELEMESNSLGQFWINPLSNVEIEIRQTGQQEQRFVNSNAVGLITPRTPANQRVIYTYADDGVYAIINNPQTWDMSKTLVYYTGYKLYLSPQQLSPGEVDQLRGEPASVPTDSLKQAHGGV